MPVWRYDTIFLISLVSWLVVGPELIPMVCWYYNFEMLGLFLHCAYIFGGLFEIGMISRRIVQRLPRTRDNLGIIELLLADWHREQQRETEPAISELADDILEKVFRQIPAYQRFAVLPGVCHKWSDIISGMRFKREELQCEVPIEEMPRRSPVARVGLMHTVRGYLQQADISSQDIRLAIVRWQLSQHLRGGVHYCKRADDGHVKLRIKCCGPLQKCNIDMGRELVETGLLMATPEPTSSTALICGWANPYLDVDDTDADDEWKILGREVIESCVWYPRSSRAQNIVPARRRQLFEIKVNLSEWQRLICAVLFLLITIGFMAGLGEIFGPNHGFGPTKFQAHFLDGKLHLTNGPNSTTVACPTLSSHVGPRCYFAVTLDEDETVVGKFISHNGTSPFWESFDWGPTSVIASQPLKRERPKNPTLEDFFLSVMESEPFTVKSFVANTKDFCRLWHYWGTSAVQGLLSCGRAVVNTLW